jgi:hypothetical protein
VKEFAVICTWPLNVNHVMNCDVCRE